MTRSFQAAKDLAGFEHVAPPLGRTISLVELFATLLDGARVEGASSIDIHYDENTGIVEVHDNAFMAAGPRTLALLRDMLAAGPVDIKKTRPDLHRYLVILACSPKMKVQTPAYSVSLSALPFLKIEKVTPVLGATHQNGVTLTFELKKLFPVSSKALQSELQKLVRGFPVEVYFNNKALMRPFSLKHDRYTAFAHGHFLLDDANLPSEHHIFLNGLPIDSGSGTPTYLPDGFVVHLHPDIFNADILSRSSLMGGAITLSFLRHELYLITGIR